MRPATWSPRGSSRSGRWPPVPYRPPPERRQPGRRTPPPPGSRSSALPPPIVTNVNGQTVRTVISSRNNFPSCEDPGMTTTLVTVAPTGAESAKADVPALPVTLDELVTTARECEALGASVIHVHIRDDEARPTLDLGRLRDTVAALRERTDLIVQLSTGGAVTDPEADRLRVLDAAPDMASCTMGTVNFGDDVFLNRWEFIVELHTRMQERAIVPEYEIC